MKKILGLLLGAYTWIDVLAVSAAEKFDILPDLPEPLAAAQASSISTTAPENNVSNAVQTVGTEPNIISVVFSLLFVILLIYATGIIYTKLNKLGFNTLKRQMHDIDGSKVAVISTTPLGNNKTLHVVELEGKRMLIGASTNSIDLIKDLGTYPPVDTEDIEYSKIEIPNIRIPKIEIPKIEFPNLGFTKTFKKHSLEENEQNDTEEVAQNKDDFEISEIYEESPDGIIDKLFTSGNNESSNAQPESPKEENIHKVDPDEYALYKKYL